ncbi:MAG: NAD-dependent epimerase/dehydratase family protein [Gemmatimonadales bacterium]
MSDPPSRPVLVTGSTGFTGGYLVRALVEAGYPVRVIVRSAAKAATLPRGVEVLEADIKDATAVARAAEGVGIIYHLAAAYREASHRESGYRQVNVGATQNLLQAAAVHGVERFVHCSTVGVLGHVANPPADETTPYSPGDPYQRTKCEAEVLALAFARERGVPVTIARPTAIYGPGDQRLLKMFRMIANGTFVLLGRGEVYYHMVYIDDLVEGLRLLAHHPAALGEVFIIGGQRYYTLKKVAELVAEYLDVPPPQLHVPAWPLQMAGTLCEKICVPLGIEPPIYRRRVDFFTKSRAFSIEKARRMLGYQPMISLEAGLRLTLEWFVRSGHITRGSPIATFA